MLKIKYPYCTDILHSTHVLTADDGGDGDPIGGGGRSNAASTPSLCSAR